MKIFTLNFTAVLVLLILVAAPIYFARNVSQVAGVKNSVNFAVISQVDKFANMSLNQENNIFEISFQKIGPSQAFLAPISLLNPTSSTKTYEIRVTSGSADVFFGENYEDTKTKISLPLGSSAPVSIFSNDGQTNEQVVQFTIETSQ